MHGLWHQTDLGLHYRTGDYQLTDLRFVIICLTVKVLNIMKGPALVALVVKNLPANAGDLRDTGSIPGSGRPWHPWRRAWKPTLAFLPGKYSPQGHTVRHDKQLSMCTPAPPQRQLGGLTMTVDTTRVPWSCPLRCSTDFCSFLSHPGHSRMTRGWKL